MKCAVIHNHPIHYKHLLFRELKKAGLDFEVIFAAGYSNIRHEDIGLDASVYRYRILYDGLYEEAPWSRRVAGTWHALSEIRPNVAIIYGYHSAEGWVAWLWTLLHAGNVVMWYESNEFDYPKRPWLKEQLKRLFLRGVERAQVYGTSSRQYLEKLGLAPERIAIKGAVVNTETFSTPTELKTYSESPRKRLLYIGRLAEEKNVEQILRAMADAIRQTGEYHWHLTVAGTGPLESELKWRCVELGIEDSVDFAGYVPQAELPDLCRQADVFILPSTREPWGNVVLEAMLCRLPIAVSTQCGCTADLVTPETGWKFSPWSTGALTAILLSLPQMSSACLAFMGDASHRMASRYSATACAARIHASLLEMTGPQIQQDRDINVPAW